MPSWNDAALALLLFSFGLPGSKGFVVRVPSCSSSSYSGPFSPHRRANTAALYTSASQQERRDEDKRRLDRAKEVVPGATSAMDGAQDCDLNIDATQEQYLQSATGLQRQIYTLTHDAMQALKFLNVELSIQKYNQIFSLKPDAYVWQAGIAYYYLDEYKAASAVFRKSTQLYETKFGETATEERIWNCACHLKDPSKIPLNEPDELQSERRKVLKLALQLFESTIDKRMDQTILARAQLHRIGVKSSQKLWRLQAWYFLGLHYDSVQNIHESQYCIKRAIAECPNPNADDIIHTLPVLHMKMRDWFDDDAVDSPIATSNNSIQRSIAPLKLYELQAILKNRSLNSLGSKRELQERLYKVLLMDFEKLISM